MRGVSSIEPDREDATETRGGGGDCNNAKRCLSRCFSLATAWTGRGGRGFSNGVEMAFGVVGQGKGGTGGISFPDVVSPLGRPKMSLRLLDFYSKRDLSTSRQKFELISDLDKP